MRTLVLVVGLCLLETVVSYGSSASNPYDNVPYEFFYDKSGDPSSQVNSQSHDARPATSFDEASAAPSASADPESSSSAAPSEANPSAAVESFNVEAPSDEGSYYGGVNEAVNSATQAAPLEETLPETTASVEPVDTRVRIASVPQQPAENPIPPPPPTDAEVHEAATEDPSLQDPAFIDISVSTKDKPQEEDPFIELEKGKRKKTTSTRHSVDTPNQLNGDVSTASRARVPHQSVSPLLPDESLLVPFTHEAQPPSTSPDQGVPRESLQHDLLTKGSEGLPLASIDEISQPSAGLSSVADSPREILAVPQPSESAVFQSKDTASLTDSTALSEGSAGVESHTEQRIEVSLAQQVAPAELPHEIGRNPTIRGTPTDVQTADVVGFKEIVPDLVGDVKVKKDAEDISLPAGTSDRAATTSGEDDEYSDEEEDDDLSTTTEPAPDPVPVDTPTITPIAPSVEQTEFAEELRTTQASLPVESFIEPEAASGKKPCCACCKEVDLKSGLETGSDEVPKKLGFGTTAPKEAKRDLIPSAPLLPQLTATAAPPQPGGFSGPFQQAVQQQVSSFQSIPPNVGVGSGGSYAQQPTFQGNYFGGNTQEGNFVQAPVQSVPQGYPQGGYSQPLPQQGYAQAYQPAPNFAQQSYSVRPSYGPSYFGGGGGGGGCGGGGGGCGGGGGSGVRNLQFYPFGCGCPTPQPCCNLPSPCCLPQLPPLPCCPKIPCCSAPPTCCAPSTGCSRGCARSMARTARAKRQSCIPCFGRKKREIEEEQHWRQKRTCVPCLKRAKRQAQSNCRSCNNLGDLIRIGPTTNTRERRSITLSWCTVCNGRRKRQAEQCINRCQQRHKRQADAEDPEITNAVHVQPEKKKSLDFDETFQCDRSCCDYSKCQSLRAKKYFLF